MDVNELLGKLKNQSDIFKDKKLMIKLGVGLGSILIFLIIYYGFVNPIVKEQKIKIAEMNDFQDKIVTFSENMVQLNQLLTTFSQNMIKIANYFIALKRLRVCIKT